MIGTHLVLLVDMWVDLIFVSVGVVQEVAVTYDLQEMTKLYVEDHCR